MTKTRTSLALLALVACAWVIRLVESFRLNVNWDEFHYVSYVYEHQRDVLEYAWASFHVHFFGWLTLIGGNEVDSIIAARVLISGLGAVSGLYIYLVARRFFSVEGALFAVLSYLSFSFVLEHGSSFRPDPLCTVLFVAAAHHLLPPARSKVTAALAGVAMAVSLMISIKGALHLVVLCAVLLTGVVTSRNRRLEIIRAGVFGLSFMAFFVAFFSGHRAMLAATSSVASQGQLASILDKVLVAGTWFPRLGYLLRSVQENPLIWLTIVVGGIWCLVQLRPGSSRRREAVLILILASPILSLARYRNAFPYFYVFALPLTVLLSGLFYDKLVEYARVRRSKITALLAGVVALAVFSGALAHHLRQPRNQQGAQEQLVTAVHEMFPEPVEYIDRCSMIASFPQVGFFMSSWGMDRYRAGETRSLTASVIEDQPAFMVANVPMLDLRIPEELGQRFEYPLLAADATTLRQNFIHHWGLVFVAGKQLRVIGRGNPTPFSLLIPGPYTLEADQPVMIGGQPVEPGGVVELEVGDHSVSAEAYGLVTLRWGRNLYRPEEEPISFPIFLGF